MSGGPVVYDRDYVYKLKADSLRRRTLVVPHQDVKWGTSVECWAVSPTNAKAEALALSERVDETGQGASLVGAVKADWVEPHVMIVVRTWEPRGDMNLMLKGSRKQHPRAAFRRFPGWFCGATAQGFTAPSRASDRNVTPLFCGSQILLGCIEDQIRPRELMVEVIRDLPFIEAVGAAPVGLYLE